MKRATYREPAFLREIHRNQISNYQKSKSLTIQERISQFVRHAHQNLERLGLQTIEFTQK